MTASRFTLHTTRGRRQRRKPAEAQARSRRRLGPVADAHLNSCIYDGHDEVSFLHDVMCGDDWAVFHLEGAHVYITWLELNS